MPEEANPSEVPAAPQTIPLAVHPQKNRLGQLMAKDAIKSREVWKGIGLLLLCHFIWLLVPSAFILIWFLQIFYGLPLMVVLYCKKKDIMAQGVMIAMSFTFLLNMTFCGFM